MFRDTLNNAPYNIIMNIVKLQTATYVLHLKIKTLLICCQIRDIKVAVTIMVSVSLKN